jgi:hypothetical protein
MGELVAAVTSRIDLDARISVYASTSGGSSAHLIHRNVDPTDGGAATPNQDGAIVLAPDSASPRYLLFAFLEDDF